MLIHEAYLCEEVRHHLRARGDAQQKAKDTIAELQIVAHPRVRMLLGKLAEQIDGATADKLVGILQQAMAATRLLAIVRPQVVADIYAKHWT